MSPRIGKPHHHKTQKKKCIPGKSYFQHQAQQQQRSPCMIKSAMQAWLCETRTVVGEPCVMRHTHAWNLQLHTFSMAQPPPTSLFASAISHVFVVVDVEGNHEKKHKPINSALFVFPCEWLETFQNSKHSESFRPFSFFFAICHTWCQRRGACKK